MKIKIAILVALLTFLLLKLNDTSMTMEQSINQTNSEWNFDQQGLVKKIAYVKDDLVRLVLGVNTRVPYNYFKLERIVTAHSGQVVNVISMNREIKAVTVEIPIKQSLIFMSEVMGKEVATFVEPNFKFQCQFVPNDPYWALQWGPQKIEAQWAWNVTIGEPSILVSVVDTGIDYSHQDLAPNYVALGRDWVHGDSDPMDDEGHGTHCAGIIAAVLNNSIGIAGVAQIKIMGEKGLDRTGSGYTDWLANAVIHSVEKGAKIISMSWGGYYHSALLYEAIKYAYDSGVLLVAAAGNDGVNAKLYPAGYDEVIAVAATDTYDNVASWSNFGDWVELAAPGVQIYSTYPGNKYVYLSGTSMATPHVSGVAALIWSQFPEKSRDWVRMRLRYTSEDIDFPGVDIHSGYGRINARKAVEQPLPNHDLAFYSWDFPPYVEPGNTVTINFTILNFGMQNENDVTIQLLIDNALTNFTVINFITNGTSATTSIKWNPDTEGNYNVTLYIVPVFDEFYVQNNIVTQFIHVGFPRKALVLNSEGNVLSFVTRNWDELNTKWSFFGNVMIYIDYKTLNKEDITYEEIAATNADVLIISSAWSSEYGWEFTDSEIDAIKRYITEGHGIIVTEATFYQLVPNNVKLASLLGLNGSLIWNYTTTMSLNIVEPNHPLFAGIPNPYSFPEVTTAVSLDGLWDTNELAGGKYVALECNKKSAIVVSERGRVYISPYLESIDPHISQNHLKLLYNAITWSPHEISVSLDVPQYIPLGESLMLNATVHNLGSINETNVLLQLMINSSTVCSKVITELSSSSSYTISYFWTPEEGEYNVTAYAAPVNGETFKINNTQTRVVRVSHFRDVGLFNISAPNAAYKGNTIKIEVLVGNLGELSETFDVTVYCGYTPITTLHVVDLLPKQNVTLALWWDTVALEPCHTYNIWAEATTLPGEINVENNVFIGVLVKIKMLGDVNGDGKINIYDVVSVASIYGCKEGEPDWDAEADLAPPWGLINLYDIVVITSVYGQTCS
jgi:thermitase